jgi:hypothetical protein
MAAETPTPLMTSYPEELQFFKRIFVWGCSHDCFFTRSFYEETVIDGPSTRGLTEQEGQLGFTSGFLIHRWRPYRTKQQKPQKLYPALVDSLVEKHLAFDNFCRSCSPKDRLKPQDWETAFWLGSVAGPRTWTSTLDIDLHERLGWITTPTRWHQPGRHSPHDTRYLPVPRPSLRFYMQAKLVYDAFPNRIWSFSSGSLGLAVWQLFSAPELTHVLDRKIRTRLKACGLGGLEHYPTPKHPRAMFGRPHRRPCGMDSGIITANGVLTDPIQQIRWFMSPGETPPFETIIHQHISAVRLAFECFLEGGGSEDHRPLNLEERKKLVAQGEETLSQVSEWLDDGCPVDARLISQGRANNPDLVISPVELGTDILNSTGVVVGNNRGKKKESLPEDLENVPSCFLSVDLPSIIEQGLWFEFVRFLAQHGFPAEDKVFEIIGTLARWFLFVELYDRPDSETIAVLTAYVTKYHNDKISRLKSNQVNEVISQIPRIVAQVRRSTDGEFGCFEDIRRKRATGRYRHSWTFVPEIMGFGAKVPTPNPETFGQKSEDSPGWTYVPDDTPLPDFLVQKIFKTFRQAGRQMRQAPDGKRPVLVAITRFINHLNTGQGSRRCSIQLLQQMGFPSSGKDLQKITGLLVKAGIVARGGYRPKSCSRLWILADECRTAAINNDAT